MVISDMQVTYRYHSGSDLEVVNAARVSFNKESNWEAVPGKERFEKPTHKLSDKDVKLINYLAKHNHWTPFAHNSVTLRIKAPIFVARQAGKHQVGLVWNEVSRRYVDDEPEFFFPKEWRGRPENAKQGSSGVITHVKWNDGGDIEEEEIAQIIPIVVEQLLNTYNQLIKGGVAPEQARMVLPQNMMTEWIWTGSLAAWSRVCKLRLDPHSQQEIQELAGMIKAVVEPLFPVSFAALMEN